MWLSGAQTPHFLHEPRPLYLPDPLRASWPLSPPFPGPLLFTLPAPFLLFPFDTSLLLFVSTSFLPLTPCFLLVFTHSFPSVVKCCYVQALSMLEGEPGSCGPDLMATNTFL